MATGLGKVPVLSNLQDVYGAGNLPACLCERLKVALTSEAALVVQAQVWGSMSSTLCSAQPLVAQQGLLRSCCVLTFTVCMHKRGVHLSCDKGVLLGKHLQLFPAELQ